MRIIILSKFHYSVFVKEMFLSVLGKAFTRMMNCESNKKDNFIKL